MQQHTKQNYLVPSHRIVFYQRTPQYHNQNHIMQLQNENNNDVPWKCIHASVF
jgi:hypothetical protein